jgi:hypothetical protein
VANNTFLSPNLISDNNAYKPQVAFTSGDQGEFLHVLWEERVGDEGAPVYRRCSDGTGTCSDPVSLYNADNTYTYPSPFLSAQGERLIAGWQVCSVAGTACKKLKMLYLRSEDAGESLINAGDDPDGIALIGSSETPGPGNIDYAGTDANVKIYRSRLQPALALDADGYPHAAWQVATNTSTYNRHMITTTYAISDTQTNFSWERAPGLELTSDTEDEDYVKPVILLPASDKIPGGNTELKGLHLFYMAGGVTDEPGYTVHYTYLHETDPSPPPTDDPDPTGEPPDPDDPDDEDHEIYLPLIQRQ